MSIAGDTRPPAPAGLTAQEHAWILERLPSPLLVLTRDLVIREVNPAAQRLCHDLGLLVRRGEPLPGSGSTPSLRELGAQLFDQRLLGERRVTAPGKTLLARGFTQGGAQLGVLIVEDTTAEDRQLQAEEDFLVNASHEFLSPLTSITAAAHVLETGGDDPEVRERFVRNIAGAANRLVLTSRALLVLARGEAGAEPPRLEVLQLEPLLRETLSTGAPAECELTIVCPRDARTLADMDLFVLAVSVLRDNACRHSRSAPARIEVAELDGGAMVSIDVVSADSGSRTPAELERLTQRFVSGEGRDSGGFGLGLSIADRAARLMGGRLVLWSGDGKFRAGLQLPAAREDAT